MPTRLTKDRRLAWPIRLAAAVIAVSAAASTTWAVIPSDALLQKLQPRGNVNDYAGILTPAERESLEGRSVALRQKTGAQLAVVILPSLEGGQIDDFTNKLFAKWGVGQKGKNNGVMLLVAIGDRKARIEVGYGLEPILPDALAGRVLREELFPAFKQQRYAQGLTQAVSRIVGIVGRGERAPPEARQGEVPPAAWVILALVLIPFAALGFGTIGAALRSRQVAPMVCPGAIFAGVAMFSAWLVSGLAFSLLAVFAVVMLVVGWKTAHLVKLGTLAGKSWASGWTMGSSSGGFGGGGFSGGGGGFGGGCSGGGGASGGW